MVTLVRRTSTFHSQVNRNILLAFLPITPSNSFESLNASPGAVTLVLTLSRSDAKVKLLSLSHRQAYSIRQIQPCYPFTRISIGCRDIMEIVSYYHDYPYLLTERRSVPNCH